MRYASVDGSVVSVCWSRPQVLQKRLSRFTCCLGEDSGGPKNDALDGNPNDPSGREGEGIRTSLSMPVLLLDIIVVAMRCYVGLVAVGVQEQAVFARRDDILVQPLLRNCLTLNDISFPSHYLPSRTVVLAIVFTV